MNEQIKQLAQQSKLAELYDRYVEQCMKNADDDILDYDVIVEQFAELIVRECMSLCTDVEEDVELADYVGGFRDGALMCREDIKKHFGVEE